MTMSTAIVLAGFGQLSILIAAALVPVGLDWRHTLAPLPKLHRQMYWVYGGYIALTVAAFGVLSITNASRLADGSPLARGLCAFIALWWGVRLVLQSIFEARPYLGSWWTRAGYSVLTVMFAILTTIYMLAALHPAAL